MTKQLLYTRLTDKFTKMNVTTSFTNTGIEICPFGYSDYTEILGLITDYLCSLGFEYKITGKKYKKVNITF